MPSGEYNNEERRCRICKRKLRPLWASEDWADRKYHITCYRELIADIHNYNKVCYTKYNHKKTIDGYEVDKLPKDHKFVLNFD